MVACGSTEDGGAKSNSNPDGSVAASGTPEPAEAFDAAAAHREAYAKARPVMVKLAAGLSSATLPLQTAQRRQLDQGLRAPRARRGE
jgi:hypothetical protein